MAQQIFSAREPWPARGVASALPRLFVLIPLILTVWFVDLKMIGGSFERLLLYSVPDDAFYYFTIARNIWRTGLISFDGQRLSNGFHPLWMLLILPLFSGKSPLLPPVFAALSLGAGLHVLSSVLLYRVLREVKTREGISAVLAIVYSLNPVMIRGVLNGLETSLLITAMLGWLIWHVRMIQSGRARPGALIVWGILAGLTFLARTDMALLLAIGGIQLIFLDESTHAVHRLLLAGIAGGAALLIAAPWLIWNYSKFGNIIQSSGYAISAAAYGGEENFSPFSRVWEVWKALKLFLYFGGFHPESVAAMGLILAFVFVRNIYDLSKITILLKEVWPILLFPPFFIAFHQAIRMLVRPWYYVQVTPIVFMALGITLEAAMRVARTRGLQAKLPILAVALFAASYAIGGLLRAANDPSWRSQLTNYRGAQWIDQNLPEGTSVGVFNAGIVGYVSEKHSIVNLDGVVNEEVIEYRVRGAMPDYLAREGICFVADFEDVLLSEFSESQMRSAGFRLIYMSGDNPNWLTYEVTGLKGQCR